MELIQSFSVDHTRIIPGIFLSRQDEVGGDAVTTYDIRLSSTLSRHSCEMIPSGRTRSFTGVRWAV